MLKFLKEGGDEISVSATQACNCWAKLSSLLNNLLTEYRGEVGGYFLLSLSSQSSVTSVVVTEKYPVSLLLLSGALFEDIHTFFPTRQLHYSEVT